MRKLIAVATVALMGAAIVAVTPEPAEARRGWGGAFAGAAIGGVIVGAILASQHRRRRSYASYSYGPSYGYAPAYAGFYYAPRRHHHRHRRWW